METYKVTLEELNNSKEIFKSLWNDMIAKTEEISTLNKQLDSYNKTLESYKKDLRDLSSIRETSIESIGGDASISADDVENEEALHNEQIANMENEYAMLQKKYNHYQDIILSIDDDNYIVVNYFISFVKEKYSNIITVAENKSAEITNNVTQEIFDNEITKLGHKKIIKMLLKINSGFFPEEKNKNMYLQYLVLCNLINTDKDEVYLRLGHHELLVQRNEYKKASNGKSANDVPDSDTYNQYKLFMNDYDVANTQTEDLNKQIKNIENKIQKSELVHKEVKNENERYNDDVNKKNVAIKDVEEKIKVIENDIQQRNTELQTIKENIKDNNGEKLYKQLKNNSEMKLIKDKSHYDILPAKILYSFSKEKKAHGDYSVDIINANFINSNEPLIITYECEDKENDATNDTFYSIVDNLNATLLSSMFIKGFELEIVDNRNQERTALEGLPLTDDYVRKELKEENNAFKFSRSVSSDYLDTVVQERTDKLKQKDILTVNKERQGDGTMEKYLLLCYRVYDNSDISVEKLYANLKDCKGSGIFPFIFIDKDTYDNNIEQFNKITKSLKLDIFNIKIGATYNGFLNISKL